MKKLLALILVVISVFSFGACGNSTQTEEKEDGIVVVNNGDLIYKEETKDSAKLLKIAFTEAGLGRDWLVDISKGFIKANPEYKIALEGDPQLASSLQTKLESGKNLADVFFPLASPWEQYSYRGWLEPLDDVYEMRPDGENGKTTEEKIDETYVEYATLETKDGMHKYILPWNDYVTGIAYNVNMFNQYGWTIPETTDQLEALCQKILTDTKQSVKPFVYPGRIGGYFDYIGSTWWMQAAGTDNYQKFWAMESAEVFNPAKPIAKAKKEALKEFERFFSTDKNYCVAGSMSKDHITAQMDFINGNAAMIINASWLETEMLTSMEEGFTMGLMKVPYLSSAKKDEDGNFVKVNYITPPDYICVPKEAKNVEGAKKFLNFMNKDETLKKYTALTGNPRPFDYDMTQIEGLTKFSQDALALRAESDCLFDWSRNPLYVNAYVGKFMGGSAPYEQLIRKETTPDRYVNFEYLNVDDGWDGWMAKV